MFEKWTMSTIETAEAHCDAPCGVYDPAQARVEAESVLQLT
jgi:nickel superoxide dismutase